MALTLPKFNVPKFAAPPKKTLGILGGVVILAAAAWFGWQYFEDAAPPPPPAKPQPVTAAKAPGAAKAATPAETAAARDKLVGDVMLASGVKQQLNQLPQKLTAGVRQFGMQQKKARPAVVKAVEIGVVESYSAQGFQDRVSAGLKKNYDEKRLQALLKDFSTPAAKRMIGMEQAAAPLEEFTRFSRSPAATKPTPARASLLKRIDAATRASDLAIEAAFSSMKGVASAAAGGGATKAAAVDKAIEKQRASASASIRDATLLNLAFSYRNASDTELEEYAKFCESDNNKWFSGVVYASLAEELQSASAKASERMGALAAAPVQPTTGKPAAPAARPARSRSGMDARACLDLASNKAIMACAEKYR